MALKIHKTRRLPAPVNPPVQPVDTGLQTRVAALEAGLNEANERIDAILTALLDEFGLEIEEDED